MKKELGLWIDHREAVIVTVAADGEEIKRISSDVEKHVRFSAHSPEGSPRPPLWRTSPPILCRGRRRDP